jgi:hypothetical protein
MKTSVPHSNKSRTFRPWPENQKQFAFAESRKLNVSELLNELVAKHFTRHVALKTAATQRALEQLGAVHSRKPSAPKLTKSRN